jgi:hypothetical protein
MRKLVLHVVVVVITLAAACSGGQTPRERKPGEPTQVPTMSKAARDLFYDLSHGHLCTPPEAQEIGITGDFFARFGSRRPNPTLGQTLKWRYVGDQADNLNGYADAIMAEVNRLAAAAFQLVKVASSDASAFLTFRLGNSIIMQSGQSYPVQGCANNPFVTDLSTPNTLTRLDIVCRPGAASLNLVRHEVVWHRVTYCHVASPDCGNSEGNGPVSPNGDCIPGEWELLRWLMQVPPGSSPQ